MSCLTCFDGTKNDGSIGTLGGCMARLKQRQIKEICQNNDCQV